MKTVRPLLVLALTLLGCQGEALRISEEAAQRQAQQNLAMSRVHEEVAATSRELAAAETEARGDHRDQASALAAERADLHQDWRRLDAERNAAAERRRTDSLLAAALESGGALLVALGVVAFAYLALVGLHRDSPPDPLLLEETLAVFVETLPDAPRLTDERKPPAELPD
jgi:hypothetical protein